MSSLWPNVQLKATTSSFLNQFQTNERVTDLSTSVSTFIIRLFIDFFPFLSVSVLFVCRCKTNFSMWLCSLTSLLFLNHEIFRVFWQRQQRQKTEKLLADGAPVTHSTINDS